MLSESGESVPEPSTRPALRLAVYYGALFAVLGVNVPFWPVWMASRGLTSAEIGMALSLGLAMKVVVNPLVGHLADRTGRRRLLMIVLSIGAASAYASLWFGHDFLSLALMAMVFFCFWSPLIPMGENLTMLLVKARGLDYGRIRLWGSLGFVAASVIAGIVLKDRHPDLIWMMVTGGIVVTALSCLLLPRATVPLSETRRWTALQVLSDRRFGVFLVMAALTLASHSAYFAFSSLHWQALGHSELIIGLLWGLGVIAEVILFVYAKQALARVGALGLLLIGGIAGVVRWSLMPLDLPLVLLFPLQVLHAFTFGAAHLGAMYFITDQVDPKLSATAQGLYSSAVMGIALSLTTLLSGYLFEAHGGLVFLAMAAMSLGGALIAGFMIKGARR